MVAWFRSQEMEYVSIIINKVRHFFGRNLPPSPPLPPASDGLPTVPATISFNGWNIARRPRMLQHRSCTPTPLAHS